jgi:AraC family transcriptional regulator
MRGLNIEYQAGWLERHELRAADPGGCRPLVSPTARLAALRFAAAAFQVGDQAVADLHTQGLELLALMASPLTGRGLGLERPWLGRAEEFLRAHFREPVSLRDAAREARVHPVHLARVFRRRYGLPVSAFLQSLRLVEAGRLVLQGTSLVDAAHAAGFSDQAHFSRLFSREFGFSPKRMRPARLGPMA